MRWRCGDYVLWVRLRRWPWPPQGWRRLYPWSVNWWMLGLGPLYVSWTPIRSQHYLRHHREREGG